MSYYEKKNDTFAKGSGNEGLLTWIKVIAMKLQRFFVTRVITLTVLDHAENSKEG